jgi:glycine hydroxymethyltransferase
MWLEGAGLICNKNGIPSDSRPPKFTSGVRLGTPAVTTRGMGEAEMGVIAGLIDRVLASGGDSATAAQVREDVRALAERFAMPGVPRVLAK